VAVVSVAGSAGLAGVAAVAGVAGVAPGVDAGGAAANAIPEPTAKATAALVSANVLIALFLSTR
jgi:hypothetical protein